LHWLKHFKRATPQTFSQPKHNRCRCVARPYDVTHSEKNKSHLLLRLKWPTCIEMYNYTYNIIAETSYSICNINMQVITNIVDRLQIYNKTVYDFIK